MSNERLNFDKNLETLQKLNFQLLYASTSKYEGDWQSLPHTHHFTELFYVISGLGKFLVEDRLITVKENDMVIVNPNVAHHLSDPAPSSDKQGSAHTDGLFDCRDCSQHGICLAVVFFADI